MTKLKTLKDLQAGDIVLYETMIQERLIKINRVTQRYAFISVGTAEVKFSRDTGYKSPREKFIRARIRIPNEKDRQRIHAKSFQSFLLLDRVRPAYLKFNNEERRIVTTIINKYLNKENL
jgi:hypothetical protein